MLLVVNFKSNCFIISTKIIISGAQLLTPDLINIFVIRPNQKFIHILMFQNVPIGFSDEGVGVYQAWDIKLKLQHCK